MKSLDRDLLPNNEKQENAEQPLHNEEVSDAELIVRLREGDTSIMDFLMKKYKPLVRKQTNAMYLMGGDQDDLIQEGMIGLFKAVRDYDVSQGVSFYHFAKLCINRQLYSAIDASNRKKHIPLNNYVSLQTKNQEDGSALQDLITEELETSPEQLLIQRETREDFFHALEGELSELERQVLERYLDGRNYIQIAEELGKMPKSIDNALQRIHKKAREVYKKFR